MSRNTISVNRAPVLTLWGAVVAERLGFEEDTSLTLGRAVAALNAQSKGQRLGIFTPAKKEAARLQPAETGGISTVEICGRTIPLRGSRPDLRAELGGKTISPVAVRTYLERAFGTDLEPVRSAFRRLAHSLDPDELTRQAYALYEQFRPDVPAGVRGWGAKGNLDLAVVRRLARRAPSERPGGHPAKGVAR